MSRNRYGTLRHSNRDHAKVEQDFADFKHYIKDRRRFPILAGLSSEQQQSLVNMASMSVGTGGSSSSIAGDLPSDGGAHNLAGTPQGPVPTPTCLPEAEQAMQLQESELPRSKRARLGKSVSWKLPSSSGSSTCDTVLPEREVQSFHFNDGGGDSPDSGSNDDLEAQSLSTSDSSSQDGSPSRSGEDAGDVTAWCQRHADLWGSDQSFTPSVSDEASALTIQPVGGFQRVEGRPLAACYTYTHPFWAQQHGKDGSSESPAAQLTLRNAHRSAARLHARDFNWDHFRRGLLQAHPKRGTDPRHRCTGGPYCPLQVCSGFPSQWYITYNNNQLGAD